MDIIKRYKHKVIDSVIDAVLYDGSPECVTAVIKMLRTSIGVNNTEFGLYLQNPKWVQMKADKGDFICKNIAYADNAPFIIPGNKMITSYEEV